MTPESCFFYFFSIMEACGQVSILVSKLLCDKMLEKKKTCAITDEGKGSCLGLSSSRIVDCGTNKVFGCVFVCGGGQRVNMGCQ